jgi:hypothetical protein
MFGFKVICWALLFIFKLRFPPGVSIATGSIGVNVNPVGFECKYAILTQVS